MIFLRKSLRFRLMAGEKIGLLLVRKAKVLVQGSFVETDLLVEGGRIREVKSLIDTPGARELDGEGLYAGPGWVDLHTHLYPLRFGGVGSREKNLGVRTGVTCLLDAGTTGAKNFEGFKERVIDRAETKIFALLNIKSLGIRFWQLGRVRTGEDDFRMISEVLSKHRGLIKGIKVTASREHMAASDPLYYVRRAIDAGNEFSLPVMVHFGLTPPELEQILPMLRSKDLLTHCFRNAGHTIFDSRGRLRPSILAARDRGVGFDLGHGVRSFSFPVLEQALLQGFDDFTISSDLYLLSRPFRARSFANVLSKFLNSGMGLEKVIAAASIKPAEWLGLERALAPGKPAELTLFRLEAGEFIFDDCWGEKRTGTQRIVPVYAISGGSLFPCRQ